MKTVVRWWFCWIWLRTQEKNQSSSCVLSQVSTPTVCFGHGWGHAPAATLAFSSPVWIEHHLPVSQASQLTQGSAPQAHPSTSVSLVLPMDQLGLPGTPLRFNYSACFMDSGDWRTMEGIWTSHCLFSREESSMVYTQESSWGRVNRSRSEQLPNMLWIHPIGWDRVNILPYSTYLFKIFVSLFKEIYSFYVYGCFAYVHVCALCACYVSGGQKKGSDPQNWSYR